MIISYVWTISALLAGQKKRTRRHWADSYARRFLVGSTHQAYNKSPRVHGHQVGTVLITSTPFKQRTSLMTEEDYELEGLKYMEEQGLLIRGNITPRSFFELWKAADDEVWVIDFEFTPQNCSYFRLAPFFLLLNSG